MNTELFIEGYRLDLSAEISALLTFAIDDIKDFSARSTTWSKTIVLPGTANNNRLFGHIFQVGQSNSYNSAQPNVGFNFNAAKAAPCILFQDQIQTFKGVLRLLQINYYGGFQGRVEYEVSVFGNLAGLNSILSSALLEDLDFSAYNHTYNDANIVNSWDNPGGSGVYYPLIDYGAYSTNKHDWDIRTFRPALYVKEYIDKMFAIAGYRYQSALFDSARFKKLIIPHSFKQLTEFTSQIYFAQMGAPVDYLGGLEFITFSITSGGGFSTVDNVTFTFAVSVTTTMTLSWEFNGTDPVGNTSSTIHIIKNGSDYYLENKTIGTTWQIKNSITISLDPGDTLAFALEFNREVTISNGSWNAVATSQVPVPISVGGSIKMNDILPKNVRQIDFLLGIVKLFNLYVYEDKNDETLFYITPYIDYYSKNFSNAVDWSQKLNYNKPMKSRPMSELNAKIYKLRYKQDSDYYNELYRKRYNEGYGDRIYDSQFEFTQQVSEFDICFSGTPMVGYVGEDKVYSTIFKQSNNNEETTDSNIRILQSKKISGVTSWNITDNSGATVLNTLTRYGYAGHLDDPDVPTNDINFGAAKELFFILTAGNLSNNQFNVYWSNYMREITDKDSKLVTANFYLTVKDILNLDFSKYVYVDGIAYRLNAIRDYNASKPADCVVELLKVNAASYSEASGNDGPPAGCYLLWSDENTLDYDDGEPLLYGDCNTNSGDGGGGGTPPPVTYSLQWSYTTAGTPGTIRIYVNNVLLIFNLTSGSSGSFLINTGDEIKVQVSAGLRIGTSKRIFVSNNVDGVVYDDTSFAITKTHTFTVGANKNYTVVGEVL